MSELQKVFTDAPCEEVAKWLSEVKAFIVKRKRGVITALFPTGILVMIVCSEGGENAD